MQTYRLKNLDCADCARKIEDGLRNQPFVRSVSVDFATLSMKIDTDEMDRVVKRVGDIEPDVRVELKKNARDEERGSFNLVRELILLGASLALFIAGAFFEYSGAPGTSALD